jgi:hypothetical protein
MDAVSLGAVAMGMLTYDIVPMTAGQPGNDSEPTINLGDLGGYRVECYGIWREPVSRIFAIQSA